MSKARRYPCPPRTRPRTRARIVGRRRQGGAGRGLVDELGHLEAAKKAWIFMRRDIYRGELTVRALGQPVALMRIFRRTRLRALFLQTSRGSCACPASRAACGIVGARYQTPRCTLMHHYSA